jgi:hypothetical protein
MGKASLRQSSGNNGYNEMKNSHSVSGRGDYLANNDENGDGDPIAENRGTNKSQRTSPLLNITVPYITRQRNLALDLVSHGPERLVFLRPTMILTAITSVSSRLVLMLKKAIT